MLVTQWLVHVSFMHACDQISNPSIPICNVTVNALPKVMVLRIHNQNHIITSYHHNIFFFLMYLSYQHLVNIRNVEGGTSDLVSSLTSGYDRPGYVPVPRPDRTSRFTKPIGVEHNNYGNVPVPTPDPSSFPTGMQSLDVKNTND